MLVGATVVEENKKEDYGFWGSPYQSRYCEPEHVWRDPDFIRYCNGEIERKPEWDLEPEKENV
jgi:hypothetical protein